MLDLLLQEFVTKHAEKGDNMPQRQQEVSIFDEEMMTSEVCLLALPEEPKEKMVTLVKLHRQFRHQRYEVN